MTLLVYADWEGLNEPTYVGALSSTWSRGKEIFSFTYSPEWLQSSYNQSIDPELGLFEGVQYLRYERSNFGVFLDSSPDRWGRVLMDRREAIVARAEKRRCRTLGEADYLLGVYDELRMGALRFKTKADGPFMSADREFATPPWTSIGDLEQACNRMEDELLEDNEASRWLQMLLAPGSSLGGARPKAGVRADDGSLWIAKFPGRNDHYDTGAWEMVVHELAAQAGLRVPQAKAACFYGKRHSFLTKRFDRTADGQRLHFASAMTLLGYSDGTNFQDNASYLELAEFIIRSGANAEQDLEELYRRIVFSICVSNTDDHLRNHGFLLTPNGWALSPAYDLNPNPQGIGLKLNISTNDNSLDLALAAEVAPYFRLSPSKAAKIIDNTRKAVSKWPTIAAKYKIPKSEQQLMSPAFKVANPDF